MSLVLEALRRQQSEDEPGTAVALALASERQRRQQTWTILLAAALLLNAAVFAWLFRDRLTGASEAPIAGTGAPLLPAAESANPTSQAPGTAALAPEPAASGTAPTGTAAAPANAPGTAPSAATAAPVQPQYPTQPAIAPSAAASAPMPIDAPPPRVLERIALDSLPPASRSRFPGIVISTHVYAEDAALRAIVVNGERLQEGDQVSGLAIREINEFGVVLEFESYLVDVPVFTDW